MDLSGIIPGYGLKRPPVNHYESWGDISCRDYRIFLDYLVSYTSDRNKAISENK